MKLSFLTILIALAFFTANAQRSAPDTLQTSAGPVIIQPIEHASLVLTAHGATIYVDPSGGADKFQGLASPDIILITDIHGDHFEIKTLDAIKTATTTLVVPQAVADKLPAADKDKLVVLKNGDYSTQSGISIRAIPMYNLPESATAMHPKGR